MKALAPLVFVTGGQGTLGQAFEREFRAANWRVKAPGRAELDVTDAAAVRAWILEETPDLLLCNAGFARDGLLLRTEAEDWSRHWEVNFEAARVCARAVLPAMMARGQGHVVFVTSHSAFHPPAGQVAYASGKAALLGLCGGLAREAGPSGVRVNAIAPGFLESGMTAGVSEARRREVLREHSLGRFNEASRVAEFVRFLHERMIHSSGQCFALDSRGLT